jgi:hypothetical protein
MQTNSFSILLVLVIGYFSFVGSAQSQPATTHCQRARIVQHRRFYDVSASYPVVKDLPNAIKLNHLIKNFVQSQIDDYQRGIGKYDGNQGKGYLNVVYNASLATKDVFSVRFQLTKYSPGAAHPLDETNAINFCPSPGEILSLKDIFRADVDYPKVLSVLCMGDLL